MNCRVLVALVLVAAGPAAAFADPADDADDLAEALIAQGWPDLAEDLLARTARERQVTWSEEAITASAHLATLETSARAIGDPFWRKEALLDLLAQTDTYVGRFAGTSAAETRKRDLPQLCMEIGETIVAAMKNALDAGAIEALRAQGETVLARAETAMRARIDVLAAAERRSEEEDFALMADRYNRARTVYLHAMLFPRQAERRKELCEAALKEFEEFDLEYADTLLNVYVCVDMGLCLRELDKTKEALAKFDEAIQVREAWGAKTDEGLWPIPADSQCIADIVCYAMLQKMYLLRDEKKLAEVVAVGREWFGSMKTPFVAPSSMHLAWELGSAQLAGGDAKGARATAESMIREDPDGVGGTWGRELLGAAGK